MSTDKPADQADPGTESNEDSNEDSNKESNKKPDKEPEIEAKAESDRAPDTETPASQESAAGSDAAPELSEKTEEKAEEKTEENSASKADLSPTPDTDQTKTPDPPPQPDPIDEQIREALLGVLQENLDFFTALGEELTEENISKLLELRGVLPDIVLQVSKSKTAGLGEQPLAFARLIKAVTLTDQNRQQIDDLLSSAEQLSHKNTNQLVSDRKLLRQFKSEIGWPLEAPKSALFNRLLATELKLDELAEKNQQFQEQLLAATKELANSLGKALEQGNSAEASALWDKIQGNIKNLSGHAQHDFKLQTNEFRNQVNELRGWKKFAATEKKKELIGQMQQLGEAKIKPADRAKQINRLHEDWKRLGYSNQNEKLWQEFKTLSDKAYAPCKEYFKQQKVAMAENFRKRTEICKQMESFLEGLDREAVKIVELKKFEDQAHEDWKKYAPIEQSKVKKLQKRFYELLNQARDIRRSAARKNGEQKQSLVKQAQQLLELEDRREAMNKARTLQTEWKTIGPSFFKDDRKYWEEFRAACDAIFKERDEARKALKSDIENALKQSNDILRQLEEILDQDEDTFRQSRKLFSSLQREFNQALSPRIKNERQRLLDRFTALSRKIEARFRKLPDKKQLQALNALQSRAEQCLKLEQQVLACNDDESLKKTVATAELESWQQLENSGMPDFDKAMETRWKTLTKLGAVKNLQKLTEDNDQQARRQVVEAEIKANLESPEQDKGLRMELQLNQLTTSFGKANMNDNKTREREARQLQLQFLCMGPLSEQVREELEPRVARVIEKLL